MVTEQCEPQVAETGTTRKRKVLGLVLVFAGVSLYPGIGILFGLGEYELTRAQTDKLVRLTFPLVWWLPIIGLGVHARAHGRTALWALTGWVPVLGPLLALVAMRIDTRLARWEFHKIPRALCAGMLTLLLPLLLLAMVIPGFRAYNKSDNIQQSSPSTSSTTILRER